MGQEKSVPQYGQHQEVCEEEKNKRSNKSASKSWTIFHALARTTNINIESTYVYPLK